jgi:spore germination protein GerM
MHDQNLPEQRPNRRIPLGVLVGAAVVLITGSATAWWTISTAPQKPQPVPALSPTDSPLPIAKPQPAVVAPEASEPIASIPVESAEPKPSAIATEQTAQVYWLKDNGTNLELVPSQVTVVAEPKPDALLLAAGNELLQGPSDTAVGSTIPTGTQLLSLETREDGIHVDLSKEFTTGGGSASMMGRLGQVLYTVTSLDPSAKVWLSVEGQPLEVLGGEGLLIDQPMTRDNFDQNFKL